MIRLRLRIHALILRLLHRLLPHRTHAFTRTVFVVAFAFADTRTALPFVRSCTFSLQIMRLRLDVAVLPICYDRLPFTLRTFYQSYVCCSLRFVRTFTVLPARVYQLRVLRYTLLLHARWVFYERYLRCVACLRAFVCW